MKTVSHAYLLGIREGRELLNSIVGRGETVTLSDARSIVSTLEALLKESFASEMADTFRGERDFWRNQIKIHLTATPRVDIN